MITFSKETLREALQGLRVLKLSKQSMPVLRQVLVFGYESLVEFTGTDLDQFLRLRRRRLELVRHPHPRAIRDAR